MIGIEGAVIGFALLLFLLLIGLHIAVALFSVAVLGAWVFFGDAMFRPFGTMMWGTLNNFLLVAIPLFVFMGEVLVRGGVTERMYRALSDWLRPLPGGLLHTNIIASTVFAAISGSSVATAATIGTVAFPTFRKQNYSERWVAGTVASGATLGILIPPSINLIIYGAITNTSIGALFMAGIVPGLILAALFMGITALWSVIDPRIAGPRGKLAPWSERRKRLSDLLPPLIIFIVVMGSIYGGWATPTEAAGVGVVIAMILVALSRRLNWEMLKEAMLSTVTTTAMTLLILVAAFYMNFILGVLGVPRVVSEFVASLDVQPLVMLLILVCLYLILGCFLDALAMMIATIPIVWPIMEQLGYSPVWFGIFLVMMCELALITPPVGMNLYIVQSVRGRGNVGTVIAGVLPFLMCILALVALLGIFPGLILG
ncbi:TRAP transporter large permease [Sinirhodobacter huangdaonensis]|uniref:TRAP transporter large permease protein n=1 Tax=Paenirhodobacter huangdaonensis TaxID=2501515 RepID=A0A443LSP7_9RHOB|nr:TRAP transporter large permease [Sinirhodobacter huangdaonensis]RWR52203.1 TRAP transporter large permease [Sinirhodobacter huangdaonensis]